MQTEIFIVKWYMSFIWFKMPQWKEKKCVNEKIKYGKCWFLVESNEHMRVHTHTLTHT